MLTSLSSTSSSSLSSAAADAGPSSSLPSSSSLSDSSSSSTSVLSSLPPSTPSHHKRVSFSEIGEFAAVSVGGGDVTATSSAVAPASLTSDSPSSSAVPASAPVIRHPHTADRIKNEKEEEKQALSRLKAFLKHHELLDDDDLEALRITLPSSPAAHSSVSLAPRWSALHEPRLSRFQSHPYFFSCCLFILFIFILILARFGAFHRRPDICSIFDPDDRELPLEESWFWISSQYAPQFQQ